jgi:ABC-type uncharacterized transport system involved in gliding motility auxiliary subunit
LQDEFEQRFTEIPAILANLSKEMIMKLKLTLASSLFAIIAAVSLNASAASEPTAETKAKVEQPAPQKNMKPHSHAQEKSGFAQKTPAAMRDQSDASKDQTKHFHPRDGK